MAGSHGSGARRIPMSTRMKITRDDRARWRALPLARRAARGRLWLGAAALALVSLLSAPGRALAAPAGRGPDEVLVRFRAGSDPGRRGALHAASRATVVKQF